MSDISKINVDGVDYDVKDVTARTEITPIERGGTGASTISEARKKLSVPIYVNLTGKLQKTAHRRSVIAFCRTGNDSVNTDSYSVGTLTAHRYNGLSGTALALITIEAKFSGDNSINSSVLTILPNDDSAQIKPCTFTYNGITYGGVELFFGAANLGSVEFIGSTNFSIFGVDYWDSQNNVAIIQEIADSINYTTVTQLSTLQFNGSNILREE